MSEERAVEERVKDVLVAQLGVAEGEVKETANIYDDLGADSLDAVEVLMAMEEEFGFEISDEEAEIIKTVGEIITAIKKKIG